jgi:hypothetical protein
LEVICDLYSEFGDKSGQDHFMLRRESSAEMKNMINDSFFHIIIREGEKNL